MVSGAALNRPLVGRLQALAPQQRRPRVGPISRLFHRSVRWAVRQLLIPYCRTPCEGEQHIPVSGPLLVACNHPTVVDPLFVVVLFPRQLDLLMNKGVRGIPMFGRLFHEGGHVTTGPGCLEECLERLRLGYAVGVFPEGQHSYSDQLGEFHKGISVLAKSSGAPVLPMGMLGHQNYLSPRASYLRGGPVRVGIGPALRCEPEESAEDFTQRLRHAVQGQMREVASPLPWQPNWHFRLLQAVWVPVSWSLFKVIDRMKPDNIR